METHALDREDGVVENDMAVVRGDTRGEKVVSDEHADHSWARGGRGAVDTYDSRVSPRRADDHRVRHARYREIDRVARRASHLGDTVRAPRRRPDDAVCLLHRALRI